MAQHSSIVGGSTAKRVIACPGSVTLVQQMPPKPSSKYADEGTLLHNAIADVLGQGSFPASHIGASYQGVTLTEELHAEKLIPALRALDAIHIASAADLAPLDGFVTYDERQAAAARLAGMRTFAPGS